MLPLAYFGIESSGLNLAIDLLILFAVVLYFSLIYWTYADARRRIADPMLVGCATVASLFPFVGTIIYMVLRPPEYLDDVRERELETQAAEARLHQFDQELCPHCSYRIERDFIRCPSCLRKLKERCANCSRPLDRAWTICPYCEADVPGLSGTTRSRRRRGASALETPSLESSALDASALEAPALEGDLGELDLSSGRTPERPVPAASSPQGEPALAADPPARSRDRRSSGSSRSGRPGGRTRPTP